jgi:transcriptional regulator with XRE-family HTH domain
MARPRGHALSLPAWEDALRLTGRHLTQVAEISEVPRATLSALRGGHHRASTSTAAAIANALGVAPGTLFPTLNPRFVEVDVEAVA